MRCLIILLGFMAVASACGSGSGGGATGTDALLQGEWFYNSGNKTYSFDSITFESANDGYPEGHFIGMSDGDRHDYLYSIDVTGTSVMFFNDLGGGTVQIVRTYNFEVSQSMLKMECWDMIAYYCKGSANACTPP